jgi:acylaminoacyl-peptidase
VLYANPRGSTSYGEAFGNLIHHAYPGDDYDDLMSGVDTAHRAGQCRHEQPVRHRRLGRRLCSRRGSSARPTASARRWLPSPVINWSSFVLTSDANNFFLPVLVRRAALGTAGAVLEALAAVAGRET